jgi:hypothetical protein
VIDSSRCFKGGGGGGGGGVTLKSESGGVARLRFLGFSLNVISPSDGFFDGGGSLLGFEGGGRVVGLSDDTSEGKFQPWSTEATGNSSLFEK